MGYNGQRVIVQLVDVEEDVDADRGIGLSLTESSNAAKRFAIQTLPRLITTIEMVDDKTLLLDVQKQNSKLHNPKTVHFDCVGRRSDVRIRAEISNVVDKFLIYCSDICLITFCQTKESHLSFISNLLMNELEKKVEMMHITFQSITLEYYDIQKYDVVNLLAEEKKRKREKLRARLRYKFSNIIELHKWFQSEYAHLWSTVVGQDCIDFHFVFLDATQRIQKVKLSLFFMYLSKMDVDTRLQLLSFFHNLGTDKRVRQNLLTDCLKEYFQGQHNWRTLLTFQIPVSKNRVGKITDEMLKLATAAYNGVKEMTKRCDLNLCKCVAPIFEGDSHSFCPINALPLSNKNPRSKLNIRNTRPWLSQKSEKQSLADIFTEKDFMSLSQWYTKIDDRYTKVIEALDAFYKLKSDWNISKLCCDIKQMMHSLDQSIYSSEGEPEPVPSNWDRDLLTCYNNYKACVVAFRSLSKEVEKSQFIDILKIYFKTKSLDLAQHATRFKFKHLENCHSRLSTAISDEMTELSHMEQALASAT